MKRKYIFAVIFIILIIPCTYSNSELSDFLSIYYGDYDESLFLEYVDIPIVAAVSDTVGISGWVRIAKLKTKNNMLVLDSRTIVDSSTIESIITSIRYIEEKTGEINDYFISYDLNTNSVSGKSTGASIALGIAALAENKRYDTDYIITGAINEKGVLLETGGILIKILSVSNSQSNKLLMSSSQTTQLVYEKYNNRFLAKHINLVEYAESLNLNLIHISNIEEIFLLILKEKV